MRLKRIKLPVSIGSDKLFTLAIISGVFINYNHRQIIREFLCFSSISKPENGTIHKLNLICRNPIWWDNETTKMDDFNLNWIQTDSYDLLNGKTV